jgi:hypothetical protein
VCRSQNGTCTKTFPRKKKKKLAAWNISKKIAQPCMHVKQAAFLHGIKKTALFSYFSWQLFSNVFMYYLHSKKLPQQL